MVVIKTLAADFELRSGQPPLWKNAVILAATLFSGARVYYALR